jgi:rhodanese-related sulfurtransferase
MTDDPHSLSPADLRARLESDAPPYLIDVREAWELEIARLLEAVHIPMGEVPDALERIPRDRPVVFMCHHGVRSAQVADWLRGQGYENVLNLRGGIDAWSRQVDPGLPVY